MTVTFGLSDLASLAAIIGVPVALGAYWFNARAVRLTEMHRLFGDYLRMKFDFTAKEQPILGLKNQLAAFKLYTLEEMFLWVERERRFAWLPSHRAALVAWAETIDFHLEIESFDNVGKTLSHRSCYTPKFFARWEKVNADHASMRAANSKRPSHARSRRH